MPADHHCGFQVVRVRQPQGSIDVAEHHFMLIPAACQRCGGSFGDTGLGLTDSIWRFPGPWSPPAANHRG
jgi:hypothetical protein